MQNVVRILMGKFIFIFVSLTVFLRSCRHADNRYNFKEIGFTIKIPDDYIIQDKFPKPNYLEANGEPVTDPVKIKQLEDDLMKGLIVVRTSDFNNTISFNIALETSRTGDFEKYWGFSKKMQIMMSKQQMVDYDTAVTSLTVENIKFHKYLTFARKGNLSQYSGIYVGKVKDYFLIIKTDYSDKTFGEVFDNAIRTSTFE